MGEVGGGYVQVSRRSRPTQWLNVNSGYATTVDVLRTLHTEHQGF